MKSTIESYFSFNIHRNIIKHTEKKVESGAFRVLKMKWDLSVSKLCACNGYLYACCPYETKDLNVSYL